MYQTTKQEEILTACPNCGAPINQDRRYSSDRVQTSCGEAACRQYVYRENKKKRLEHERTTARDYVRQYCATHLPAELSEVVRTAADLLITSDEEGYTQARKLIEAIELKRCKHQKISILEANAANAKRATEQAHAYNKQLETLYQARVAQLEEEVRVYQANENLIHGIVKEELERQPEEA